MNRCHQGCGEQCRACEAAERVADTANGAPITVKDLGDMLLMGHVMAMVSAMVRRRGPLSSLHLCDQHARFAMATAETMGVELVIGHPTNVAAVAGMH